MADAVVFDEQNALGGDAAGWGDVDGGFRPAVVFGGEEVPRLGNGVVELLLGSTFGPGEVHVGGEPNADGGCIAGVEFGEFDLHFHFRQWGIDEFQIAQDGRFFVQPADHGHPAFAPEAAPVEIEAVGHVLSELPGRLAASEADLGLVSKPGPGEAPGGGHLVADFPEADAQGLGVAEQLLALLRPGGVGRVAKAYEIGGLLGTAVAEIDHHLELHARLSGKLGGVLQVELVVESQTRLPVVVVRLVAEGPANDPGRQGLERFPKLGVLEPGEVRRGGQVVAPPGGGHFVQVGLSGKMNHGLGGQPAMKTQE